MLFKKVKNEVLYFEVLKCIKDLWHISFKFILEDFIFSFLDLKLRTSNILYNNNHKYYSRIVEYSHFFSILKIFASKIKIMKIFILLRFFDEHY